MKIDRFTHQLFPNLDWQTLNQYNLNHSGNKFTYSMNDDTLQKSTLHIVYHSKDFDGIFSGLFVLLNNMINDKYTELNLIEYNYEKEGIEIIDNPEKYLQENEDVIFIDVTPPIEWFEKVSVLEQIHQNKNSIKIFDHHLLKNLHIIRNLKDIHNSTEYTEFNFVGQITSVDENTIDVFNFTSDRVWIDLYTPINKVEQNNFDISALAVYYETQMESYHNTGSLKDLVYLISDYDTWTFYKKNDEIPLRLQYGLCQEYLSKKYSANEIVNLLFQNIKQTNQLDIDYHIAIGSNIIHYKKEYAYTIEDCVVNFEGKKFFLVFNHQADYFITEYVKQERPYLSGVMYVKQQKGENSYGLIDEFSVSLRQIASFFDCAKFAMQFNGGGHKGAAGFTMSITEFFQRLSYSNN